MLSTHRDHDYNRPARSEDRLLLDEAHHRTANEVAAALAAMRLAKSAKSRARQRLMDEAILRLEGFGRVHQLMGSPVPRVADASMAIEAVVGAIVAGRFTRGPSNITLELPSTRVDGETARGLVIVAHELVLNAIKYAFGPRGGRMTVRLEQGSGAVTLTVQDDGAGIAPGAPKGSGLGTAIVREIVARRNGVIECETGPLGTAVRVTLPYNAEASAKRATRAHRQ